MNSARGADPATDLARVDAPPAAGFSVMQGRLIIVAATILWSSNGLFAKSTLFDVWPKEQRGLILAFWRALFAGLFLVPFIRKPRFRVAQLPLWLVFTLMNITFLSSMALTTTANTIWLQNTAPLWIFLVGTFALGHSVVRRDLVTLVFAVLGAGTIVFFEMQNSPAGELRGVWLGLASGFCFGMVVLCLGNLKHEDSAWVVASNHLVAATVIGIMVLPLGIWPSGWQWPVLMGFGAIQMGLPYLLFGVALRKVPSQEASGLCLLEPILSPVWVWLAWNEEPRWWTVVGAALILAGLTVRYAWPTPREASV